MTYFDIEQGGGVAVVWLDHPASKVNKVSRELLQDFATLLDTLESDATIKAAVLISRKPDSFVVGADIEEFKNFATPAEAKAVIQEAHRLLNRLERLTKPVVAAIHGACMGAGLELSLACSYRIATDHQKTRLALPEVNLGLLPGAGGTQRLPRQVGVQQALEIMLTGKNVYPKPARKMGLVDATIHHAGLLQAAKTVAGQLASGERRPSQKTPSWKDRLLEQTPLNRLVYNKVEENVQRKTKGHYPAPQKIIDCVRIGQERGLEAGLSAEAEHFSELLFTPQSRALIHLFFAKNAAEKNPLKDQAHDIHTVGVLGAGLMGAGIAQVSARGGFDVLLKDRTLELAAKGKGAVWNGLSERVGKGISTFERDLTVGRVQATETYDAFDSADIVIEAVSEDLSLKRQMLAEVEAAAQPHTIFASNTSSIPIADIAAEAARPEQVLGMHYFSPVPKMPLLEIIKTDKTANWGLGTAIQLGLQQGKTIIVVGDKPGFYANRILAPYLDEALRLLGEGASVEAIDGAMTRFGFPVGPLKLLDEVGLDVGAHVTEVMRPLFAERGVDLQQVGEELLAAGFKGRKSAKGFYDYAGSSKGKREVNSEIYRFFGGGERKSFDPKLIQERLALAMVNEAVICLEEGIIASARDGDVGAVFGIGFPPFLGGPFWYADEQGLASVVERLEGLEQAHGPRFKPSALLRNYAEAGKTFYKQ